jgi:hypothetical protein
LGHQPFCVTIIGSIFVSFVCFLEKIQIKQVISNVYQYFSFLKILLSVFIPLKIAAFVNSGGHIGLRNSF